MNKLLAITLGVALAGIGTVALAARNTSGVYSLPSGNPVSTRTTISASWANSTMGDISSAISGSLSRDGWGGMRAPLALTDGTVNAPGLSFVSESGSGLYRIGTNDVGLSLNQAKRQEWTTTGTVVNGTVGIADSTTGNACTLKVPAGLAVGYTMTLPAALPASQQILTLDASGNVAPSTTLPAASLTVSGGGITFNGSGEQVLTKSGGAIVIGTSDANAFAVRTNGTNALIVDSSQALNMQNHTIYSLATPTTADMAATKGYVDAGRRVFGMLVNSGGGVTYSSSAAPFITGITGSYSAPNYGINITISGISLGSDLYCSGTATNAAGNLFVPIVTSTSVGASTAHLGFQVKGGDNSPVAMSTYWTCVL